TLPTKGTRGHRAPILLSRQVPTVPGGQYAVPGTYSNHLLRSYLRHVARLPHPDHPEYKFLRVKLYRVVHRILLPGEVAEDWDPRDLTTYLPYYEGTYDKDGTMLVLKKGSSLTAPVFITPDYDKHGTLLN